jgi:hypothetical protein
MVPQILVDPYQKTGHGKEWYQKYQQQMQKKNFHAESVETGRSSPLEPQVTPVSPGSPWGERGALPPIRTQVSGLMSALGTSAYHLSSGSDSDDSNPSDTEGLRLPHPVTSPDIETGKRPARFLQHHDSGEQSGQEEQEPVAIVIHSGAAPCYDSDFSGGEDGHPGAGPGRSPQSPSQQRSLPPISRITEARKSYAMANASNEISARFRKKNAQEILAKRLELKKGQKASSGLSQQQSSLSPEASPAQSWDEDEDSKSKSTVRKELRKRLESNIARHRVSVLMNESTARERLERRLREKSLHSGG